MSGARPFDVVRLDDDEGVLVIMDQTLLPGTPTYLRLAATDDIWEAIHALRVRGALAIGIAAAYGSYLGIRASRAADWEELAAEFGGVKARLASARPTAVNLFGALDRMEARLNAMKGRSPSSVKAGLKAEADAIRAEDIEVCRRIGEHSLSLLKKGWGLLTHCNAGALGTAGDGTATAPMYLGAERGYGFSIYSDETRPLLQGVRLTSWELSQAGIDVTVICDNMASIVMKQGRIQAVLVGCDRVAANGDTANKIGTSGVAILARHYCIPFYVHAPLSTVDLNCPTGAQIPIEERAGEEITEMWYARRMAPAGVKVYNPAFDVTDNSLITAIITEKGIAYPPYKEYLAGLA
jgi:methylthioribose-1-phosphate isomerase